MLWCISPARSRRTPPAGFIRPCQPLLVARPPAGPGWLHEVKHDGYRLLARKEGERVHLWTRYGADFTDRLPRIAEAVRGLLAESSLIDGEAVAFRPGGHSDFVALLTKSGGAQACLVAFDLLGLDGADLRQRPLEERRDRLALLIDGVVFSEAIEDGARSYSPTRASWALRGSCRSGLAAATGAGRAATSKSSQRVAPKTFSHSSIGIAPRSTRQLFLLKAKMSTLVASSELRAE